MQPKRIHINRGSLSPFTSSAILQLMQEFNRKEDAKQCLHLAKVFKERAAKLKKEPCRQPSKKKKRTEADKLKRAEAFAKIKAGKYVPVAVASRLDERAAVRQEYQPPAPPVPVKTAAQIAVDTARAIDLEIGRERNEAWAQDEYDSPPPATAPSRPTAPAWTPPPPTPTYEPVHEESGYDIAWRRQEAAQQA